MKNYTTKERNSAALILSVCANNNNDQGDTYLPEGAANDLDIKSKRARQLADDVCNATPMDDRANYAPITWSEQCAEAESWVRSGWSQPGDEHDFKVKRERLQVVASACTPEQLAVDDDTDDEYYDEY